MALVWVAVTIGGLALALAASRGAVQHASAMAFGTKIPPFVVGITLIAIGTDLPEIANSIAASISGHGDINVGDSVGSAMTQVTLVLGLLPILVGAFVVDGRQVVLPGLFTVGALFGIAWLVSDGTLSRADGLLLVTSWIVLSVIVWKTSKATEPSLVVPTRKRSHHALMALVMLGLVGGGATAAVLAFVELAELLSVPEYIIAFFATSIGTSLPELMVDVVALRRGERDLAIGDIFGSSLVDSTLSIGIGPAIAPTLVTAELALRGTLVAAGGVLAATLTLRLAKRHDWKSALILLVVYAAVFPLVLA